jgi:plastocyanin
LSQQSAGPATSRTRWQLASLALALCALAAAGCGSKSYGGSSSSAAAPATTASTPATTASTPTSTSPSAAGGESSSSGAGGSLSLSTNSEGQLAYSTTSLSAKAGKVTIAFTNSAPLSHNLTVESPSGSTVGATPTFQGGTKTLSLSLKPGTYKFFCTVPGHRQAGMEGTLTVK